MGHTTPEEWDTHYTDGKTFRQLGDGERRLPAEHAPPPDGGVALDVGCGDGCVGRDCVPAGRVALHQG
ncbi:hypothetical protein [Streptomyces sp. NPDC001401]|uniref:hypothetical protein n=1 Tax=Streptomyces sp. NPDC001401 TaxID=3364570 RepID=UPI0036A15684